MLFMRKTTALPSAAEALPGRAQPIPTASTHFVNGHRLKPPYPEGLEQAVFGLGCFWGAERKFWELGDPRRPGGRGRPSRAVRRPARRGRRAGTRPASRPGGRRSTSRSSRAATTARPRPAPTPSSPRGSRRVVAAMADPFPKVAGGGLARLRAAGVEVEVGPSRPTARAAQRPLPEAAGDRAALRHGQVGDDPRRQDRRRPRATAAGSPGPRSRALVHELRGPDGRDPRRDRHRPGRRPPADRPAARPADRRPGRARQRRPAPPRRAGSPGPPARSPSGSPSPTAPRADRREALAAARLRDPRVPRRPGRSRSSRCSTSSAGGA